MGNSLKLDKSHGRSVKNKQAYSLRCTQSLWVLQFMCLYFIMVGSPNLHYSFIYLLYFSDSASPID